MILLRFIALGIWVREDEKAGGAWGMFNHLQHPWGIKPTLYIIIKSAAKPP